MPEFFVGIGAQKCASTWLYQILSDHPEVSLSATKELDFFSHWYNRGYQWYERHWTLTPSVLAFGEVSPSYFCEPGVPERIKSYNPKARILLSLRDPVDRAISNHLHEIRVGHLKGPDLSFEFGLRNNPMYLEQSRYGYHLSRWIRAFPIEQILILFMDDIETDPREVETRVQQFLGIATGHRSAALADRSNVGRLYRFHRINQARKAVRRIVKRLGLDPVWKQAQAAGLQKIYRRLNWRPTTEVMAPVSCETRDRLREQLVDDIRLLESISGRLLENWILGSAKS